MAKIKIPGFDSVPKVRPRADLKFTKTRKAKIDEPEVEDNLRLVTQDELDVQQAGQDWLNKSLAELSNPSPATELAMDFVQEGVEQGVKGAPKLNLLPGAAKAAAGNPILNAAFKAVTGIADNVLAKTLGAAAGLAGYSSDLNAGEDENLALWKAESEAKRKLYEAENKINSDPLEFAYVPPKSTKVPEGKVSGDPSKPLAPRQPEGRIVERLKPGQRLVATFGNWQESRDEKGNVVVIEVPRPDSTPMILNTDDVLRRQAQKSQTPSLDEQLAKLQHMEGAERIEATIGMTQMAEEAMARRLAQLTQVADSQVGYNEARQALDLNKAEDVRSGFTARKPGAISKETEEAFNIVNQTQLQSQRTLQNLLLSDPEYQKLEAISKNLQRWQSAAGIIMAAKSTEEAQTGWINADVLTAYKLAFDADTSDTKLAKQTIFQRANKDKTFNKIVQINRDNIITALADDDIAVRQAAWKIAYNGEKALGNDLALVDRIKSIVTNRESVLNAKNPGKPMNEAKRKALNEGILTAGGSKEKAERYRENLLPLIYEAISEHAMQHYSDMSKWNTGNDPELNRIINDVKMANNGRAKFADVFGVYLSKDLPQEEFKKRQQLVAQALTSTLKMDKESWLIPSKASFHSQVMAAVNTSLQQSTASYLLSRLGKMDPTGFGLAFDFGKGLASGN